MIPQLRRVVLLTAVMVIAGACSGPGQLDADEQPIPYDQFILGMPVAPADGWDDFNRRMAKPEEARTSHGEVIMNITLNDAGRVTQVEPLFFDERLLESTVAAVRDTEFLPVDSDVNLGELHFTLNVSYLRGGQYGAAVGFFDIQEEFPFLNVDEATTVVGKRYLYGYGPDFSEKVEEIPPEIIGGIESIHQAVRFPRQEQIGGIRNI